MLNKAYVRPDTSDLQFININDIHSSFTYSLYTSKHSM